MTTETRNEAAERLRGFIQGPYELDEEHLWRMVREALAAERRATVERIRAALLDIGDEDGFTTTGRVRRILDEEAAR